MGHVCHITLGKMLQPSPSGPRDREVPYLRSGSLDSLGGPHAWRTMYCDPSELRSYGLNTGDLLVAEGGEVGRAEFAPDLPADAIFQNSLHRLRLRADGDLRFVRYSLEAVRSSGWLDVLCNRTTFGHLTVEKLRQLRIPWPSSSEQTAIADYLDSETARIDDSISKKRHLLELLRERGVAYGHQILTRSRTTRVHMPLKHLVSDSDLRYGNGPEPQALSVSIHSGVVPRSEISDKKSRADDLSNYKVCKPGDIAINRMRAFQGGVGIVRNRGVVSPDYTVLRVGARISAEYLHFVMRSPWFISEMARRLRGIGAAEQGQVRTPRINFADLGLIEVPVPSLEHQNSLAALLIKQDAWLARIASLLDQQMTTLAQRRQALVADVMSARTGSTSSVL